MPKYFFEGKREYTLIIDEVTQCIQEIEVTPSDLKLLLREFIEPTEATRDRKNPIKEYQWRESQKNYNGCFNKYKKMVSAGGVFSDGHVLAKMMSTATLMHFNHLTSICNPSVYIIANPIMPSLCPSLCHHYPPHYASPFPLFHH